MTTRMPTVFFGHGSPAIAMVQNATTRSWHAIAQSMPKPKAILCISAHWLTRGVGLTAQDRPPTIHDFGGFPREMHEMQYPAPGDLALVDRVRQLVAPEPVVPSGDWGFDHGCWTVLMKCWPDADIPVVQLSLDVRKTPQDHYALGRKLRPLRDEGVLIMGTGNIVHNLRNLERRENVVPHAYAKSFSDSIKNAIRADDPATVIDFEKLGIAASQSVPTPDHFWPLLYVLGARHDDDAVQMEPDFIEYGSIDMTTVLLGNEAPAF